MIRSEKYTKSLGNIEMVSKLPPDMELERWWDEHGMNNHHGRKSTARQAWEEAKRLFGCVEGQTD